ncbi:MAG: adenosylmethionine--8-amino-7-oxononanoate transaminase [Candidatus Saganbacteria bacterium]|nr:adenosylmethionine--8-amino-7-oxononanoate transaminase [Candidatus Saganbacteria bacterium]
MNKRSQRLLALDKKHLWHPFTPMREWAAHDQLIIERGGGSYLYDTDGNKYLDGVSSLWVTLHGHRQKEIDQAIRAQLDKVAHSTLLGLANVPALELAAELIKLAPPGLSRVFYSDDGSTAVEIALKIAFQYWQQTKLPTSNLKLQNKSKITNFKSKTKFVTFVNAYHGDTIGSVSVGGIDLFHKIYRPLLFKSLKVKMGDAAALENVLKKRHREIAAVIMEPLVQAAAGMLMAPRGFLKKARQLCTRYDVLLICDEVATGFGRTGRMFACEHEGITPDLICVAKGLTGGYLPVAATLATEKIYRAFLGRPEENRTFFHGHTFTGNPLGCAAALASLKLFKKERRLDNVRKNIKLLEKELPKFRALEQVLEIRRCGAMVGIELRPDGKPGLGHRVILEARRRGAILRPLGEVIVLMPPLSITQAELKKLLNITYQSIETTTALIR